MEVIIDEYAGFCPGVVRAVKNAEKILETEGELYCLGELVHNDEEIKRLKKIGLNIIDNDDLKMIHQKNIMFRAHGEPPESFFKTEENRHKLFDNTCPIVKSLQKKIRELYERENNAEIVIFGKANHPEVIGLKGQTDNTAIVVEKESDIEKIDFSRDLFMFSQTTMNEYEYISVSKILKEKADLHNIKFESHNTICGQVKRRVDHLRNFARENDVVIFVSGKSSSNGKYLFSVVKQENRDSFFISSLDEISDNWFKNVKRVGVSGATSTPPWLLKETADLIKSR